VDSQQKRAGQFVNEDGKGVHEFACGFDKTKVIFKNYNEPG
jgi:hypothetical protein